MARTCSLGLSDLCRIRHQDFLGRGLAGGQNQAKSGALSLFEVLNPKCLTQTLSHQFQFLRPPNMDALNIVFFRDLGYTMMPLLGLQEVYDE